VWLILKIYLKNIHGKGGIVIDMRAIIHSEEKGTEKIAVNIIGITISIARICDRLLILTRGHYYSPSKFRKSEPKSHN
jgi:hypothetical protein